MNDKLIEELKARQDKIRRDIHAYISLEDANLHDRAITALEAQAAEIERLKRNTERFRDANGKVDDALVQLEGLLETEQP